VADGPLPSVFELAQADFKVGSMLIAVLLEVGLIAVLLEVGLIVVSLEAGWIAALLEVGQDQNASA